MAVIQINGAHISYETFGDPADSGAPVVLIHGSTSTGKTDWGLVAPLLARTRRVIVPDCRGHGQSSNPAPSYSFRQMAEDISELILRLGFQRAHIIGHSNGGNVALVTLLEFPQVVQSAVLQAANAYVSPDLFEREPRIFDPDRVAEEAPDWMEEMIRLHGKVHGTGYWRELLQMTVAEILREPNYTAEDLEKVQRPVLVIQGERDQVNAPARHAQFIAAQIPFAEIWTPADTGHSVHQERLFEWIDRVERFLDRRGDAPNETLYRLGKERFSDQRIMVFDLKARRNQQKPGQLLLEGQVLTGDQLVEAVQRLKKTQPEEKFDTQNVRIWIRPETGWALINRPVTDLRRSPHSLAERVSQGLIGEAVQILGIDEEWSRVRMQRDGYLGWVHSAALHCCSQDDVMRYQAACQVRVVESLLPARLAAEPLPGNEAGKLPFGVKLAVEKQTGSASQVRLPDSRLWWVDSAGLLPFELCPTPNPAGIGFAVELIKRFVGVPYLWGGRSPFGFDCSGFAAAFWDFLGITLPRDADQQFQTGQPIPGDPQPGDLLFFGSLSDESGDVRQKDRFAAISHVGISLGNDLMIHANGAAWSVSYNSLNPGSPMYRAWLPEHFAGARRYA